MSETSEIEGWVPIFLFATLFGLSMDYEVFLVSRMREAWDEVPDNTGRSRTASPRSGRVVTAAAAIMVVAFAGFVAGRVVGLQQLGFGLALGVLIDATIVRMLVLPSLMAVLGRYNWWLPASRRPDRSGRAVSASAMTTGRARRRPSRRGQRSRSPT